MEVKMEGDSNTTSVEANIQSNKETQNVTLKREPLEDSLEDALVSSSKQVKLTKEASEEGEIQDSTSNDEESLKEEGEIVEAEVNEVKVKIEADDSDSGEIKDEFVKNRDADNASNYSEWSDDDGDELLENCNNEQSTSKNKNDTVKVENGEDNPCETKVKG